MEKSFKKIINIDEFKRFPSTKTVLCYGHFSVLHPGHIRYLNHGANRGEKLLVLVRGEQSEIEKDAEFLKFREAERAEALAALSMIDQVIKQGSLTLIEAVKILKPNLFLLGREFEQSKKKAIVEAISYVKEIGSEVEFHAGDTNYSVSELDTNNLDSEAQKRERQILQVCKNQDISIRRIIDETKKFNEASLLVVGDTIIDQYIACDAVGMSAEAPVIVLKELEQKMFLGGAGIVAAHIKSFGAKCHYISAVGDDDLAKKAAFFLDEFGVTHDLIKDDSRPTTFKTRYMVEHQKMFRVSKLKEHALAEDLETQVIEKIAKAAPHVDGILVSDFVYGVITPKVLSEIKRVSEKHGLLLFGDLQCSSQVGNILKFEKFDLICPTEREARISLGNKDDGVEFVANTILDKTGCKNLILKLGAEGFITYGDRPKKLTNREHFPALNPNPLDVAGAGDSLIAAVAVCLCSKLPIMEASLMGTLVAANTVSFVGNRPVKSHEIDQKLRSLTS